MYIINVFIEIFYSWEIKVEERINDCSINIRKIILF